ncbi:uncharacterized protein METZ01_LOCUS301297 [marine metagenome]|uniref:Uncharacterized protein n=1 Tax=marine metagenome TaxID=408172 RepID=A0A382MHH5_9ZZZZ
MKHILAIVLAGLTVQAGFASEATNAIAESGHPDVSIEVFVQSTGSSREKIDQDPSFFARGKRLTEQTLKSIAFKLYPYSRHEDWMKKEIVRIEDGLNDAVTTLGTTLLDSGEADIKACLECASEASTDVRGATKKIANVAAEMLAVQLVDLNRLLSVNAPVSGDDIEIRRWLGERSMGRRIQR